MQHLLYIVIFLVEQFCNFKNERNITEQFRGKHYTDWCQVITQLLNINGLTRHQNQAVITHKYTNQYATEESTVYANRHNCAVHLIRCPVTSLDQTS